MKNIHVLPTDKPSRLAYDFDNLILNSRLLSPILYKTQNIYITSDEEIKEGDWIYRPTDNTVLKCTKDMLISVKHLGLIWNKDNKKIILTTDQNLIKDGVQAIDDEFLEWFVKNLNCESVNIENNYRVKSGTVQEHKDGKAGYEYFHYKIIIPQEEPKQETLEEELEKIDNTLIRYSTEESEYWYHYKVGVLDGLKWQAEKMYSEEDLKEAFYQGWVLSGAGVSFREAINKWFEQFKKK